MTREAFKLLSLQEKDRFLESEESFSESEEAISNTDKSAPILETVVSVEAPFKPEVVCCDSTPVIAPETQQQVASAEEIFPLSLQEDPQSSQPAASLSSEI